MLAPDKDFLNGKFLMCKYLATLLSRSVIRPSRQTTYVYIEGLERGADYGLLTVCVHNLLCLEDDKGGDY